MTPESIDSLALLECPPCRSQKKAYNWKLLHSHIGKQWVSVKWGKAAVVFTTHILYIQVEWVSPVGFLSNNDTICEPDKIFPREVLVVKCLASWPQEGREGIWGTIMWFCQFCFIYFMPSYWMHIHVELLYLPSEVNFVSLWSICLHTW